MAFTEREVNAVRFSQFDAWLASEEDADRRLDDTDPRQFVQPDGDQELLANTRRQSSAG